MKVAGCNALVTGAGGGLGMAFIQVLAERNAAKIYAAAPDPQDVAPAVERYRSLLQPVRLDLRRPADIAAVRRNCPDIDLLISNAGLAAFGAVLDIDDTVCRDVFEVNVFGPLALLRAFTPLLRQRRGGVLVVNSLTGLIVSRSAPVYGASKAAARMLALGLREQLARDAVQVTISHPGFIDTAMAAGVDLPKASPREVAERSLDGLEQGVTSVFPDRFAEIVRAALTERMPAILEHPQRVSTDLVGQYLRDLEES